MQACDARGKVTPESSPIEATARLVTGTELDDIRSKVVAKYGFMTKVTKVTKLLESVGGFIKRNLIPYGDLGVVISRLPDPSRAVDGGPVRGTYIHRLWQGLLRETGPMDTETRLERTARPYRLVSDGVVIAGVGGAGVHLPDTAAIVWELLEQPHTFSELLEHLGELYPGVDLDVIGADVNAMLGTMIDEGIVGAG